MENNERNKSLQYGPVIFKKGRHKGKRGFYDDDAVTSGGNPCAIVYLGEPFKSEYYRVRHDELKNEKVEAFA